MWKSLIALLIVAESGLAGTVADETSGNSDTECCAPMKDDAKTDSRSENSGPALVCTLTTAEMRERRAAVLDLLSERAIRAEETADGYKVTFENGSGRDIVEFIELERQCCSFFTFTLSYGPESAEPVLTISGPEGSKAFLGPTISSWNNVDNPE